MVVKTLLTMTLVGVAGLEATPQPRVVGVDTIGGPGLELPEVIVPAGSKHYIMYKKPGQDGWPTLWINLYDNNGQLWSKHYETPSSPGHGFQRVLSTAVDYLGNLYFSYEHNVPGMISRTVKLGVDGNKVWEIDHTYSTIMPMPGAKDVLTSGVGTARLAQDSGARLWSTPLGGVAVSDNYSSVFAVAAYKDLKVGKVDQLGALKYERTFNYPQHTTSEVKGVFVSEDQGFLAVVLRYHSSQPETIVVHRFDSQGYLLGTHEIETGLQLAKHTPIQVVHTRNDWVTIAWDNRHHDGGPGGRWKVVRVAFSPSQEAQPSDPRKFRLRQPWVGETKFSKTLLRGYSYLADMTVSETGQIVLVGSDTRNPDYVRVTVLSRFEDGPSKTLAYRRPHRHARAVGMHRSGQSIYVLAQDDALAGPTWGSDSDVLRIKVSLAPKPTIKFKPKAPTTLPKPTKLPRR